MFFVLKELFTALLLALVVSGGIVAVIALMARSTHARYDFFDLKPILILGITLILLFAEALFLFGAVRVRRQIDQKWNLVAMSIQQAQSVGQNLGNDQLEALIRQQIPAAEDFVSFGREELNASTANAAAIATAYYRELRSGVSGYIWKRLLWLVGFALVGGFLMINDAAKQSRRSRAYAAYLNEY